MAHRQAWGAQGVAIGSTCATPAKCWLEIGEGGSRLLELRWYSPAIPLWSLSK
jgi:hypothetical protein